MTNKIVVRAMFRHDVRYMLNHWWERGQQEAMMLGMQNMNDVADFVYSRLQDEDKWVMVADQPVAMVGGYPCGEPGDYVTWFMATDEFTRYYREITRNLKKILLSRSCLPRVNRVVTYSACVHEKAEKWFKILGLVPDHDYNQKSALKRFVYTKR